jgi:FkbM family methyltransferase
MIDFLRKRRHKSRKLEDVMFGGINNMLSIFVGKTNAAKLMFDFFGRVLPLPQTEVRGVPIKIIIPLNQVGVYNTFKDWEKREPEVLDWIDGFAAGCIFFDIGASFGTETLYAALKKNGPQKIVAIDASLDSSLNLAYNIALNNINNVDQYFVALSDGMNIYAYSDPTQYYHVKGRPKYDFIHYNTLSISLDQFIKMTRLTPDYLKIDVDGAEQDIIHGMAETVKNRRLKSVAIEVSDQSEPAIQQFFMEHGFKVERERRWEEVGKIFKNIIFSRPESGPGK